MIPNGPQLFGFDPFEIITIKPKLSNKLPELQLLASWYEGLKLGLLLCIRVAFAL